MTRMRVAVCHIDCVPYCRKAEAAGAGDPGEALSCRLPRNQ